MSFNRPCRKENCAAYISNGVLITCSADGSYKDLPKGDFICINPLVGYGNTEEVREYLERE
jgi:hypothetical protein